MKDTFIWTDVNGAEHSIQCTGHKILCRRCKADTDAFLIGELEKEPQEVISMIESYSDMPTNWVEVLAIGPDVGKAYPLELRKKYNLKGAAIGFPLEQGMFAILPDQTPTGRMWRGVTGYECDIMTEDHVPIGYYNV